MSEQTPIILSTIGNPVLGLMPKIEVNKATVADVPTWNTSNTQEQSGTPKTALEPEPEQPGTPMEHGEQLSDLLEQLLAGTLEKAVFGDGFPAEQEDKMKLANAIIKQELGLEKTIWLLWGVRRGGRNHTLYKEARAMLEKLTGVSNSEDDDSDNN